MVVVAVAVGAVVVVVVVVAVAVAVAVVVGGAMKEDPQPYTGTLRLVTLIHQFGGKREGLQAILMKAGKKPNQVHVFWPLDVPQVFNLKTGREWGTGKRRPSRWKLSDEDLKYFRKEAKT